MSDNNNNNGEDADIWREMTEPRHLAGSMSDCMPPKDETPDALTGRGQLGKLVLDKYRIDSFLDGGSVGQIFSGTQERLGRPVAIKILRRQDGPRAELAKKRFVREAKFLASMNHPNVVEMFDFGETSDGDVVMVMEKLEGNTLKEHIERGPLPVERVLRIAEQIANAVGRAHDLGGVHRDLKPANIFIERDAKDLDLIKVLDFGLVKPAGKKSAGSALTLSGFVLGTPFYMSPEQAMGDKLDATADVYSLGIMLYEMLTGVPPFRGDSVAEILAKHMEASPAPMATANPRLQVPARLEALVRACLEKVPTARPPTMFELAQNLTAIHVAMVAAEAAEKAAKEAKAAGARGDRDPSGLQQSLQGWDPNRSSDDVVIPPLANEFPDQWHESSVSGTSEAWNESSHEPLVQPVPGSTGGVTAAAPWSDKSSGSPLPSDWNERSHNPWLEQSGVSGDWSDRSNSSQGGLPAAPVPQAPLPPPQQLTLPKSPPSPLPAPTQAPVAAVRAPTPMTAPAAALSAPKRPPTPLTAQPSTLGPADSTDRALMPVQQGGQLLPPPSISGPPEPIAPAAPPRRSLTPVLIILGIVMIALALGVVYWADTSLNDADAKPRPTRPRACLELPACNQDFNKLGA